MVVPAVVIVVAAAFFKICDAFDAVDIVVGFAIGIDIFVADAIVAVFVPAILLFLLNSRTFPILKCLYNLAMAVANTFAVSTASILIGLPSL